MSHSCRVAFTMVSAVVAAIGMLDRTAYTQRAVPSDPIPAGPYRRIEPWGQLPDGMKWAAVIGAEPGPDGNMYVLHRCSANSCAGRREPPLLEFDPSGRLLHSWGVGMFVFPHGFHVDREGNVWATDQQGREGKGQQVFKFIEDIESTAIEHSGAEGVGVDARGNVFGAVVRRQMLEKHERR